MRTLILASAMLAAVACDCGGRAPRDELASSEAPLVLAEGTRLLDRSDDRRRTLVGRLRPARENADPLLAYDVAYRVDGVERPWPHAVPLQDARFLPDGTVAAVDAESTLLQVDPEHGRTTLLDAPASFGLDASRACGCLVYLRGEAPETALVVLDLATKRTRVVSEELSPAWLPVLDPDGRSVVLVSARSGVPGLWRVPIDGGAPVQLTNADVDPAKPEGLVPFPEDPDRPVFTGDLLLFQARGTVHALGLDGRVRWSRPGLGVPRWDRRGESVVFDGSAPVRVLDLGRAP